MHVNAGAQTGPERFPRQRDLQQQSNAQGNVHARAGRWKASLEWMNEQKRPALTVCQQTVLFAGAGSVTQLSASTPQRTKDRSYA